MQRVMYKGVIMSTVMAAAVISANCGGGNSPSDSSSPSILGPSANNESLNARGGGKPGGGGGGSTDGSSSLSLRMVTDNNGDGQPNWSDQITFVISTTATSEPNVSLKCSQNGTVVYSASAGYYPAYPWPGTQTMTLRSTKWTGGAADCTAKLYYFSGTSTINLTSISFRAGA
jgi:hypothetical protein